MSEKGDSSFDEEENIKEYDCVAEEEEDHNTKKVQTKAEEGEEEEDFFEEEDMDIYEDDIMLGMTEKEYDAIEIPEYLKGFQDLKEKIFKINEENADNVMEFIKEKFNKEDAYTIERILFEAMAYLPNLTSFLFPLYKAVMRHFRCYFDPHMINTDSVIGYNFTGQLCPSVFTSPYSFSDDPIEKIIFFDDLSELKKTKLNEEKTDTYLDMCGRYRAVKCACYILKNADASMISQDTIDLIASSCDVFVIKALDSIGADYKIYPFYHMFIDKTEKIVSIESKFGCKMLNPVLIAATTNVRLFFAYTQVANNSQLLFLLEQCIAVGNNRFSQYLIDKGIKIKDMDRFMAAAISKGLSTIPILSIKKFGNSEVFEDLDSVICSACRCGSADLIPTFFSKLSVDQYGNEKYLENACLSGSLDVVKMVYKYSSIIANKVSGHSQLFFNARESLSKELIMFLINNGARIVHVDNDNDEKAFVYTHDIVSKVMSDKLSLSDMNEKGNMYLNEVVNGVNIPTGISYTVKELNNGKYPGDETMLHYSASTTYDQFIDLCNTYISDYSVVYHRSDKESDLTPLHIAAENEFEQDAIKMIDFLLGKGIDINAKDSRNCTPLFHAVDSTNYYTAKHLIEKGADPNIVSLEKGNIIHAAARHRNMKLLKLAIKHCTGINQVDNIGQTPIFITATYGWTEGVKALIKGGADVNAIDNEKWTPLIIAIKNENSKCVKILMENGADPSIKTVKGKNAVYLSVGTDSFQYLIKANKGINQAAYKNNKTPLLKALLVNQDQAKTLIELGADVNAKLLNGTTALHNAYQSKELFNILLEKGLDINAKRPGYFSNETPLYCAIVKHCDFIDEYIKNGANANHLLMKNNKDNMSTMLMIAAKYNNYQAINVLIENGVDVNAVNAGNATALDIAIKNESIESAVELINKGAASSGDENDCFIASARKCLTSVVIAFIEKGFDPNLIVKIAVENNEVDVVKYILNFDVDLNVCYEDGNSLLHIACKNNSLRIVELLISKDVDVFAENFNNELPIDISCNEKNDEIVSILIDEMLKDKGKFSSYNYSIISVSFLGNADLVSRLIKNGANVNCLAYNYNSPISSACLGGNLETVKLLVSNGANLDVLTFDEETVLYSACKGGNLRIVEFLISHGVDTNYVSFTSETLLHVACKNGKNEIAKYLIDAGFDVNAIDCYGKTPFDYAIDSESSDCICLLLSKDVHVSKLRSSFLVFAESINDEEGQHLIDCGGDASNECGVIIVSNAETLCLIKELAKAGRKLQFYKIE